MKKAIRSKIIGLRNQLSKDHVVDKSHKIYENLLTLHLFKKDMKILVYMDFKNEVMTSEIIDYILNNQMVLLLPRVDQKTNLLSIHEVKTLDDLIQSRYGILEPRLEAHSIDHCDIDLILAPGVAFDKNGFRLGYGGGFYDKLLVNKRVDVKVVALSFDLQIVDRVPVEAHDLKVDCIVTESQILHTPAGYRVNKAKNPL